MIEGYNYCETENGDDFETLVLFPYLPYEKLLTVVLIMHTEQYSTSWK